MAIWLLLAQAGSVARAGRFEISGAAIWTGGYDAGGQPALETRNPSTGSSPLTLFTVDSRLVAAPGVEARLGLYLSRRLLVEGSLQFSRPVLRSHLAADFESAADTDAEATIASYTIAGSALYHFGRGRLRPFVKAGGGYVRELLEDNAAVVTGAEVHTGGGLRCALTKSAHPLWLRVDGAVSVREKAVAFDRKQKIVPQLAGGLSWRF